MSQPLFRIIHLSDWHLSHPPRNPLAYLSKRLAAYAATVVKKNRQFDPHRLQNGFDLIAELEPTHLVISGDVTTTGSEEEFEKADHWIRKMQTIAPTLIVPGNHDHYLNRSETRGFYKWLPEWLPTALSSQLASELYRNRVISCEIGQIEFILLDQCRPTPLGSAKGIFNAAMQQKLLEKLNEPCKGKARFVVGHYPLHSLNHTSQELEGYQQLSHCLQGHSDLLYLHGHTHEAHLIDERAYGSALTIDAGSLCQKQHPTFAQIELYEASARLEFKQYDALHGWSTRQSFVWSRDSSF